MRRELFVLLPDGCGDLTITPSAADRDNAFQARLLAELRVMPEDSASSRRSAAGRTVRSRESMPAAVQKILAFGLVAVAGGAIFLGVQYLEVTSFGRTLDRICIKGRLTAAEAALLSRLGAQENDRVLNRDCSELIRAITRPDSAP